MHTSLTADECNVGHLTPKWEMVPYTVSHTTGAARAEDETDKRAAGAADKPYCSLPCLLLLLLWFDCKFPWRGALWSFSSWVFGPRGDGKRSPVNLDSSVSARCLLQCCPRITEKLDCEGSPYGCCAIDLLTKMTPLIEGSYHPARTCHQGHTTHAKGLQTCCP